MANCETRAVIQKKFLFWKLQICIMYENQSNSYTVVTFFLYAAKPRINGLVTVLYEIVPNIFIIIRGLNFTDYIFSQLRLFGQHCTLLHGRADIA